MMCNLDNINKNKQFNLMKLENHFHSMLKTSLKFPETYIFEQQTSLALRADSQVGWPNNFFNVLELFSL